MKTKFYILAMLLSAAGLQINGQSQNSQSSHRILGTLGEQPKNTSTTINTPVKTENTTLVVESGKSNPANKVKEENTTTPAVATDKKVYPTIINESAPKTQLAVSTKKIQESETAKVDNNTFNFYNNEKCYNTMLYAAELIKQAEELSAIEQVLRTGAKTKTGEEKAKLLKSASELRSQAELKQIQASEIAGKLNLEKFENNKIIFIVLIKKVSANESVIEDAKMINTEAEHNMKLAREMREEAYAMHSNAAKLGSMSNAEEKENIALTKQDEAIGIIKKYTAGNSTPKKGNDLAAK